VTRLAVGLFCLLVAATFAAFFVTQRIKRTPPAVQAVHRSTPVISPNGDGVRDEVRYAFKLKEDDDVTVAIVDADGDEVRRLATSEPANAYRQMRVGWDGRNDEGRVAPDGLYRLRVALRRAGRAVLVPRAVTVDTRRPRPVVASVSPDVFPGTDNVLIRFRGPARRSPEIIIYRTDGPKPRIVHTFRAARRAHTVAWDGTLANGRRAPGGTYLVAVRVRDSAGNVGTSTPFPPRAGEIRGHPGLTIRDVAVQPPYLPVTAGQNATFFVDARGSSYRWSIRRVGSQRPVKRGEKRKAKLVVRAPGGRSGVYLLEARAQGHVTRVPFAVRSGDKHRVLVVLPWITWQGRNEVDDDQDGIPNTLDRVVPAAYQRVFAGDGIPDGFEPVAPLLVFLDRDHRRYDLTTDLALQVGLGPSLDAARGVILAGDSTWMPDALQARLRRYVRGGGQVLSLGTDSLRRSVRVTDRALADPSGRSARDPFGARIRPLQRRPEGEQPTIVGFEPDRVGLFEGTDGQLGQWPAWEETAGIRGGSVAASGGLELGLRPVIVAERLGRGLVIRTGLPDWTARIKTDPNVAEVTRRSWALLSR
jgi:flagellar hook assembly protein FlgD